MIKDYLNSTIHDFIVFYSSLNLFGIILFYSIITIIITIIILIGLLAKNRNFTKSNKELNNLPIMEDIKSTVVNQIKDNNLSNNLVTAVNQTELVNRDIINLDDITKKMEQDIENKNIILTSFEEEQEENSIISYDELLQKTIKLPLDDINQHANEEVKKTEINYSNSYEEKLITQEEKKFTSSPLISPVHGVKQDRNILIDNNDYLEKTLSIRGLSSEIKKNDEFLKALKDLKNNLD